MKLKLSIFIILLMTGYLGTSQNQEHSETSYSNAIGFGSHSFLDKSRPSTTDGNLGRKIQVNIWYPGMIKYDAVKIEFSDYLKVKHNEQGNNQPMEDFDKTVESYFQWPLSQGANKSLIDSISSASIVMKASKNLDFAPGNYPIVLLIHGSAVDFAFLAESLVEEGYVVVNVPIKGYSNKELDVNGIGMETEIRDYEFALASLPANKSYNLKDISAIGFSFGGQSAVGLACRNSNIKSVISYDGGIGTKFGSRLIDESPFCRTENISTSILHIYDASYTQNYLDKIKSFVYSDRTLIGLDHIAHWHFTSFGYLASEFPKLFGEKEYSNHGYDTILEITKNFLSARLNNQNDYQIINNEYKLISEVEHYQPIKK